MLKSQSRLRDSFSAHFLAFFIYFFASSATAHNVNPVDWHFPSLIFQEVAREDSELKSFQTVDTEGGERSRATMATERLQADSAQVINKSQYAGLET